MIHQSNGVILLLEVCDDRSCLSSLLRAHRHNRHDSRSPVWIAQRASQRRLDHLRPHRDRRRVTVIGWFLLAIALASADAYRGTADRIPTIQYGILVPVIIGGLLIWGSPRVARIIETVPQHWLVGVQLYRALGVIFLILYAAGKLPGLFAWPAGLGDVLGAARECRSGLRVEPIWACRSRRRGVDGIFDFPLAITAICFRSAERTH